MTKSRSAITAVLLCFLLALTLSGCGKSSNAASTTTTTTTTSDIQMAVAADNQQVTISWTDPSSTSTSNTTYNVYSSTSPFDATPKDDIGKTVFLIASGVTSPFLHTGLTNGTPYYYFVTRVSGSTDGPASLSAEAVPAAATPAAPTGVAISTTSLNSSKSGSVTLTIPKPDSKLTYNVYWSKSTGVTKLNGTKIPNAFGSTGTTFTHSGLDNDGTTYYYIVTAVGDSESDASSQLSATPAILANATSYNAVGPVYSAFGTPPSLEVDVANQAVSIKCGAATGPDPNNTEPAPLTTAKSYNLYYWDSNSSKNNATKIPNIPVGNIEGISFVLNNNIANNTTYFFYVTAVQTVKDGTGTIVSAKESPQSATISVVPQAKLLAVPSAVAASAGDQQVSLSWTKVSDPTGGAVKYNVYCTNTLPAASATTPKTSWSLIGTTTATSFVHSGLTAGKSYTYYYVITSVSDQSGESAGNWTSSQVSVKL